MRDGIGQWSDSVGDSRQRVGGGYEFRLKHGVRLIEESPVDSDENLAVAHGIVRRNERIVVACKQEHIAVCEEDMGFLDFERNGKVNKGEIANGHLVLQVEGTGGRHVGIGVVFGEITYRYAGMQRGYLVEYGLRIADFQLALNPGQVHDLLVARIL